MDNTRHASPRTSFNDENDALIPDQHDDQHDHDMDQAHTCGCEYNQHVVALLLLSFSFFLLFAPFSAIQNLESSLNASDKLGATAIATLYLVYTAGCLLAPAVVGSFGPTKSMICSGVFVCLFIAAHFHPSWNSLIPAAVLVGLGCAFMWAAQGVYITKIAVNYAESTGSDKFAYLGLFNGIFWGLFNCNQVAGNLISSVILKAGQSPSILAKLFLVFLSLSAIAVATLFLLPSPEKSGTTIDRTKNNTNETNETNETTTKYDVEQHNQDDQEDQEGLGHPDKGTPPNNTASLEVMLKSMITILARREILLLLPMFLYSGFVFGFLCSDFTNTLVRESLGVHEIGLVMSVFGLGDGLACLLFGKLSDWVGRPPIIAYGVVVHALIFLFLLTWSVHANAHTVLYTVAWFYGTADAAFCTQIYAIIGVRFPNDMEAAFSTYRMWNSIGMAAAFYASAHWAWHLKVVFLILLVGVSALGYAALLLSDATLLNGNEEGIDIDAGYLQRVLVKVCGGGENSGVGRGSKFHGTGKNVA